MPDNAPLPAGVAAWLAKALPGQQVVSGTRLAGGYSADTSAISTAAGHRFVLRRYLRANTCAIEAALAARLAGIVAVPRVIAADPDGSAAGEPVLLSEFIDGAPLSRVLAAGDPDDADLGLAAGAALAAIGTVRFPGGGLFTGPDLVPSQDPELLPSSLTQFVDRCLAGSRGHGLSGAEQDGLRELAWAAEPLLAHISGACQLVHSDYNPKNLLVAPGPAGWTVTAVLDWEFAFSGSPLTDIGNMLRFRDELPAAFAAAFIAGFRASGGELPDQWRAISAALDLFALADFLTRPAGHPYAAKAVAVIRDRLAGSG